MFSKEKVHCILRFSFPDALHCSGLRSIAKPQLPVGGLYARRVSLLRITFHYILLREKTGLGKAGVRVRQEGHAILREEALFHHSLSPHRPRQRELLSHNSILRGPVNHLFIFLSTDFTRHLF